MDNTAAKSLALRVSVISIIVNILLAVFKLIAGILGKSSAMISDAIHSASDFMTTFAVIAGINISHKKADEDHPYGHERMECLVAIGVSVVLLIVGVGIGWSGILKIINRNTIPLVTPGLLALIAAIVGIAVKEWMYWFTILAARKTKSEILKADAWHHRSDGLSSIGSLIGIAGARMGLPIMDPIASIVICAFIIKVAVDIIISSTRKLTDTSCDKETVEQIRRVISEQEGVLSIDSLMTRSFASRFFVDVEIGVDSRLSLQEAHDIAEKVHQEIETAFDDAKHCMVHVNPHHVETLPQT
ncbi:MAG: cation diffusion facilitator family transporter [Clostridiales bacterium]|nr:cation diffusion facilitator family transporter [Clostridiales bacterium]